MSFDINPPLLYMLLLIILPSSYDNFKCTIKARDNFLDSETLKVKIVKEYDARFRQTKSE